MRRVVLAVCLVVSLAGCAVGPEYKEPQVEVPEEWPDEVLLTGEERADWSNWWHRFDDPVLNRLVERALDDNLNMQLQYQRLQEARARLGLADHAAAYPRHLSGGQAQRTAIARALIHRPAVLLADELTGNLDEETAVAVMDLLTETVAELGTTTLVVTHAPEVAERAHAGYRLAHHRLQREW